jgi:cytochrome c biogenesis protein CcdA/thiol-disulfide isomerase/thioredoxin
MLAIVFAFVAGVLTILSPCILPLVPLVLATGASGSRTRPIGILAGLAVSFTAATLALSALLGAVGLPQDTLRWLGIAALAGFGLVLLVPALGVRLAPVFGRLAGAGAFGGGRGFAGGLLLGLTLGVVWAPCAGPIMATVIVVSATQGVMPLAVAITLAYVIGVGVPLLGIAYGGRALAARLRRALGPAGGRVPQALGAVALLTSLAIALGWDLRLQTLAGSYLPADWSARLLAIEDQPAVRRELQALNATDSSGMEPAPFLAGAQATPAALPANPPAPAVPPSTEALAPPTAPAAPLRPMLPDLGSAAELRGTGAWFNSEPTTMMALRGKVVVLNFWTFGCYNCVNTLPYIKAWHDKYADQGLVILGVHTPEFAYEKVAANVADAVAQKGIKYPVVQDNDFQTWRAYDNHYWPAFYFIDAQGHIRHTHWGEGRYAENEQVIQQLLAEASSE